MTIAVEPNAVSNFLFHVEPDFTYNDPKFVLVRENGWGLGYCFKDRTLADKAVADLNDAITADAIS